MIKGEKYAVDRIEEGFAVLENIKTKEIKVISLLSLPVVKEKDILEYRDNKYYKDDNEKNKRINEMKEKLNKLKSIK